MPLTGEDVASKDLVIFDFDGTLVDSMPGIIRTARSVMHRHGWSDEALGDMRRIVGPPFPAAFTEVYGVDPEEAMRITEEYRAVYQNLGTACASGGGTGGPPAARWPSPPSRGSSCWTAASTSTGSATSSICRWVRSATTARPRP